MNVEAQRSRDERMRYGDSLKFLYIRGYEEGPELEGEFGVPEDYFGLRGWLGGVFIPVKFRMEATGSTRRFTDLIKLSTDCYYSPGFTVAITDKNRKIVSERTSTGYDRKQVDLSVADLPPGKYALSFFSQQDSLIQSIWFIKPEKGRR